MLLVPQGLAFEQSNGHGAAWASRSVCACVCLSHALTSPQAQAQPYETET